MRQTTEMETQQAEVDQLMREWSLSLLGRGGWWSRDRMLRLIRGSGLPWMCK